MKNKIQKIILLVIFLVALVAVGVFLTSKKTASFGIKNEQVIAKETVARPEKKPIKILFVGDMMFDRYIRQIADKRGAGYSFQKIQSILQSNDLVVGNLEGPITDKQSVSIDSVIGSKENYIFTFDKKFAGVLEKENIKLVNIGNNHILNFGFPGVESTRKYLSETGVEFFGDPENEENRMKIEKLKGFEIAFVNYNQFVGQAEQKTLDDLDRARAQKVDLIILYTHWGTEFVTGQPSDKIKNLAHKFIENGADLIIGTHPHVVQDKEEYAGKMIYYSLGNFIFDQYFSPETKKGLAVQVEISPEKKLQFRDFSLKMATNGQTSQL